MTLVPVFLEKEFLVRAMLGAATPWGAPLLLGLAGSRPAAPEDQLTLLVYEWPVEEWANIGGAIGKGELEELHLARIQSDVLASQGSTPFESVSRGADPPDFVATYRGQSVGLELTQLTLTDRRLAHGLFRRVRNALLEANRRDLQHLQGCVLYMWFGDEGDPTGLPHRRSDDVPLQAIVDAVIEYELAPGPMLMPNGALPEQAPDPRIDRTRFAASFYPVPMINAVPTTTFFDRTGFEIGLGYTTELSPESAWGELDRLVTAHDTPGVDVLVVTAGGVDSFGTSFPSETIAADLALSDARELSPPEHIKELWLHRWDTGEVQQLWPERRLIARPSFAGQSSRTASGRSRGRPWSPSQPRSVKPVSATRRRHGAT